MPPERAAPPTTVCDAGGLLVVAGLLQGWAPEGSEVVALDWTAMTVGRFIAARYEGRSERIELEIGLAVSHVDEWFPVRTIVARVLRRAGLQAVDLLDSWSALVLAEHLAVPLLSANDEITSDVVPVLSPWG